jgi:hypothetical protein
MAEKERFMASEYVSHLWRPSTGIGNFDVEYAPKTGLLTVTVNCKFWFKDGKQEDWDEDDPDGWRWKPDEILKWKADFLRKVSAKWSGQFMFHCTRDWWEDLQAAVQVRFVESTSKDAHWDLQVAKTPGLEDHQSRVRSPKFNKRKGRVFLGADDIIQGEKVHGDQTVAFHEAGHMLGLGDEYSKDKKVKHEKLVQAEFGHGVPRHKDGRLMSDGDLMVPEYGVTFLEALRVITDMKQWSYHAKPPATVLSEPVDGQAPVKQDPLAPTPPQVALA